MSAWRIEIRTGFYHRAKKTRPVKGLKLNPAVWRGWVLSAQCKTLGFVIHPPHLGSRIASLIANFDNCITLNSVIRT